MRRVIFMMLFIFLAFPLLAVFEWNSESGGDFQGGEDSVTVTWDLTDLTLPSTNKYWFVQNNVSTDTAVIEVAYKDGKFIGYGTFEFHWEITSLSNQTLSLYVGGPMTSDSGNTLDWVLSWNDDTIIGSESLSGCGYAENNALVIAKHDPKKAITTSESIPIVCSTDNILKTEFDMFSGYVYVVVNSEG